MKRKRYMISWKCGDDFGRDQWVMERRGNISSGDIKQLEYGIADKWELRKPVIITNVVAIN